VAKFWLILYRKGRKRGRTSGKFVFLLFSSQIIGKSKNYYIYPTDIDKDSFVFIRQNAFKMEKLLYRGATFSAQRPNFSGELAGKVCQELATLLL
jgi:hypothetical protein